MKRTTYIIIGLILTVLVGVAALSYFKMREYSEREVSSSPCRLPLELDGTIEEVEFSSRHAIYHDLIFNSIVIEMNDSVRNPYLTIDSLFRDYIDVSVLDHRLKLEMLSDPLDGDGDKSEMMLNLCIDYKNKITLYLPRLPLKSVTSDAPMRIRSLETDKIIMYSDGHLDLDSCRIDSLMLTAKGGAKLKFRDSAIDYMRLRLNSNFVKIDCCDSTAIIRKLDFTARKGKKTDVYLNQANIDTLRWDQTDVSQLTLRMRQPINIVK